MTSRTSTTRLRSDVLRGGAGVLAALLLAACGGAFEEGPARTEARDVGGFHSVNLRGAADASIRVGEAPSLSATADDATLRELRTEVRHGMLIVEQKGGWPWSRKGLKLDITVPELREVVISGAGDITVDGARGQSLELSLQGAGNLVAGGEIHSLTVHINGAGNASLAGLHAREARVVVNGTGDVTVRASDALDAVVNGVGSVRYLGTPPRLETQVNGVGGIERIEEPAGPGA